MAWRRLGGEGARFLAVGLLASLIALFLFNALVHGIGFGRGPMNTWPLPAFVLANLVGMLVSYAGARYWAFRHREPLGHVTGGLAFLVLNLVSLVIPMTCLAISRYLLGLDGPLADNVSANLVGLFLGMVFRFWASRRFIFRRPRRPSREPLARR